MKPLSPRDRWLFDSDSESSKRSRNEIMDRFCERTGKTDRELLEIAAKVPSGQPPVEIEDALARYLEWREQ